jgi:uncharacterized protein DUF1638
MTETPSTMFIACGALAHEVMHLVEANAWQNVSVSCIPASYHNTPQLIPEAMRKKIRRYKSSYDRIVALFADCGTGGLLDKVLEEEGVTRIPGAHCYEFFSGTPQFMEMAEEEPGSFYLTDFLAKHFETLIWKGLGMEEHPELIDMYFGNYKRIVYLAQTDNEEIAALARHAADVLGLEYVYKYTGMDGLGGFMTRQLDMECS